MCLFSRTDRKLTTDIRDYLTRYSVYNKRFSKYCGCSMSTEETEKSYRVLPFSGKHDDWHMWSRKFLARAKLKKYKDVLTGLEEVPGIDEEIDVTTKGGKIKTLARTANDIAYNNLLLSCSDEVSFGAVDEALTIKLPDGDAAKAWAKLVAKYEP